MATRRKQAKKAGRHFVAVDGEAIDGRYVLLCASDGKTAYSRNELSTLDCFEFLIKLKRRSPKGTIFVAFGLNYDVNMILRDVPVHKLTELWKTGEARVSLAGNAFRLRWIPRKMFELYSADFNTWIKIYDVFGFFQSSFVKALAAWGIEDPNEDIKRMKSERARFREEQREAIRRYCLDECRLLVTLCEKLDAALRDAGIRLSSWMGAGSVAAALLRKEHVSNFHRYDTDFPSDVQEAIMRGYFGGRVEQFLQGIITNVVGYDIRSAYPSESLRLPSLVGGRWRPATEDDFESQHLHAIWEVEWQGLTGDVMPFPLRVNRNEIFFPTNGRGFYHHCEVKAALALHPTIRILRGFVFEPADDAKPFGFVRDYYQMRAEAKAAGNASEKAFKLGLNSLYGKLAQGIAANGVPPFRSLFWAGRITAGTRAKMLDAASLNPHGVVSIATDGIVFSGDPGIVESAKLGGWERTEYDEIFTAQSGIYWARRKDGTETKRTRGFFLKEIDFEDLRKGWLEQGIFYSQRVACECGKCNCSCNPVIPRRRFVGLGAALMRQDFSVWRTWQVSERILKLHSSRKFYDHEENARVMRLRPPTFGAILASEPYVAKSHTLPLIEEFREMIEGFEQPNPSPDG